MVLGFQDPRKKGRLARPQEPGEEGDGQTGVQLRRDAGCGLRCFSDGYRHILKRSVVRTISILYVGYDIDSKPCLFVDPRRAGGLYTACVIR